MRTIRIAMLLTIVMLASMSFATSTASPGSHSPPALTTTLRAELQPIMLSGFQLPEPPSVVVIAADPVMDFGVSKNHPAYALNQKGGSDHALGYWKVNRCRLCK